MKKLANYTDETDIIPVQVEQFREEGYVLLDMSIGTNVPQGGDSGHGGITIFKLTDIEQAAIQLKVTNSGKSHEFYSVEAVELILGGDAEGYLLLECFERAAQVMRRQIAKTSEKYRTK